MQQTAVIGDIHGCLDALNALLKLVLPEAHTIIFLGDYVDRGPDSKGVVETILNLQKNFPRVIPLKGNHDFLFQQYFDRGEQDLFLSVGGRQTLTSYGIDTSEPYPQKKIPQSHLLFFRNLTLYFEDQYGVYVHAGLQPDTHLSLQRPDWCLWARDEFINTEFHFSKPIVFGHTAFSEPLVTKDKIGIDTGAVYGGDLTALLLPEMRFLSVPGERLPSGHLSHPLLYGK